MLINKAGKSFFTILILGFYFSMIISCGKTKGYNPDIPPAMVQIDIQPDAIFYQKLNTVGGWIYLKNGDPGVYLSPESRGVIIYRLSQDVFKVYDRIPPNNPNKCGNTTQLIVGDNYPFAKDPCTLDLYQLLDGNLFKGNGVYPMIQYKSYYDGTSLHVYN